MPNNRKVVYWDACCFLSYINEIADRLPILDALLSTSASGGILIYTSVLSKVEVAFSASEQRGEVLDDETEQHIENLWTDPNALTTVEYHDGIDMNARGLIRSAITRGWSLKPLDAIHLATAQWLSNLGLTVDEFHTYDESLFR
jgi:predicted nucleic acid-binding protein